MRLKTDTGGCLFLVFSEEFDCFAYLRIALVLGECFARVDVMNNIFFTDALEGTAGSLYLRNKLHTVLRSIFFEEGAECAYLSLSTAETVK